MMLLDRPRAGDCSVWRRRCRNYNVRSRRDDHCRGRRTTTTAAGESTTTAAAAGDLDALYGSRKG